MAQSMSARSSLIPFYLHYALVALAMSMAVVIGVAVYERFIGPFPNSASTGATIGLLYAVGGLSAERFVRVNGRAPDLSERRRLASVGSLLSLLTGIGSGLVMVVFHYVTAFLVAHPVYQLSYYVMRQQLVAMWADLGAGVLLLIVGVQVCFRGFWGTEYLGGPIGGPRGGLL